MHIGFQNNMNITHEIHHTTAHDHLTGQKTSIGVGGGVCYTGMFVFAGWDGGFSYFQILVFIVATI